MNNTRCVALVGPFLSGKTSLMESFLSASGAIKRKGSVKDGTSVGDSAVEARSRNMSTEVSVAEMNYLGDDWAVLDCPGSIELMQEAINALSVADVAVVVVEPSVSRAASAAPIFRALEFGNVPHMVYINKVDTVTDPMPEVLAAIRDASGMPNLMRNFPVTNEETVTGYVDLTSLRTYSYVEGQESREVEFPSQLKDEIDLSREEFLEALSNFDDGILELLLEDQVPKIEEIYAKAAGAMRDCQVVPYYFGSAERNFGVRRILKALRHDAPEPERRAEALGFNPEGEPTVQVFKTLYAQHSGKLSYARVWSGEIADGQTLGGSRISSIQLMTGGQSRKISNAKFGDVVGLGRLEEVRTGHVLRADSGEPDSSGTDSGLSAVYSVAITPADRKDEVKLTTCLQRLIEEDPSLGYNQNEDTHELVLTGQGTVHLQIALEKLKSKFNVEASARQPNVPYRETIRGKVTQHGRFKRQTGGHGMFGDVTVDIVPRPRGSGFEFTNKIVGGAIPRQYIPAVESGVREFAAEGPLGFPVVDFGITLTDGQFHSVDSNEMSFKLAARVAMTDGMPKCSPVLLEPIDKVTIDVPTDHTSKVHGLISGRRGQILGYEAKEGWKGWDSLHAYLPESEIHDLIIELRSLTQGLGTFTAEFDHFQELVGRQADEVVAKRAEQKKEQRNN